MALLFEKSLFTLEFENIIVAAKSSSVKILFVAALRFISSTFLIHVKLADL